MTGRFHLPREHGGWTLWGTAIVAGAIHALGHGAPRGLVLMLGGGLFLLYAAGDWAQSAIAEWVGLPMRGRSDPDSAVGVVLLVGGFVLGLVATMPLDAGWLLDLGLVPAVMATHERAKRKPFDRVLLAVSSFALSVPALLFGALAAPGCVKCALAFWSLPAVGYPLLTLLIATRLPAPPATVKRLGWIAAAVTVILAGAWVARFRLLSK